MTVIDMSSAATGAVPAQRPQPEPSAKGAVYRIDAGGGSEIIWEFRDDQPFDLLVEDGGSLLVATGNAGKIYRLAGEPWRAMLLTRFDAQQITAMLGAGSVRYFATSNPAHVVRVDAGRAADGLFLSEARDAGTVASWGTLTWRAIQTAPGAVQISTRSGNTPVPDDTWSEWAGPYQRADGDAVKSPPARHLQWKAVLKGQAGDVSGPALVSMSIAYFQQNRRPRVSSITVYPPGIVFQKPYPTGEADIAGLGEVPPEARVPVFSAPLGGAAQSPSAGPAARPPHVPEGVAGVRVEGRRRERRSTAVRPLLSAGGRRRMEEPAARLDGSDRGLGHDVGPGRDLRPEDRRHRRGEQPPRNGPGR